jgi:hypothetical protein
MFLKGLFMVFKTIFFRLFLFLIFFIGFINLGYAGDIEPFGVYDSTRGNGDHTYGYQVFLWKDNNKLIGEMIYWYGDIEGVRENISLSKFNQKTKSIQFSALFKRRSIKPKPVIIKFDGFLRGNDLVGMMEIDDREIKKKTKESVFLKKNNSYYLKTFKNQTQWKKSDKKYHFLN